MTMMVQDPSGMPQHPVRKRDPRLLSASSDGAAAAKSGGNILGRSGWGATIRYGKVGSGRRRGSGFSSRVLASIAVAAFIGIFWGIGAGGSDTGEAALGQSASGQPSPFERFSTCGYGAEDDCVIDGGSFRMNGERVRLADVDTPETLAASCDAERDLGERAQQRLGQLLNAGPVQLNAVAGRDRDEYRRLLRIASIDGVSLGSLLIREGLARRAGGGHAGWC